jgi:peptidyl-prolyl cis-trans isomerase SurA
MEMSKEKIISIVVAVLIVAGGIYYGFFVAGKGGAKPAVTTTNTNSVATVNGTTLLKSDFDSQLATAVASLKAQGVDTTSASQVALIKSQVLENMINNELVLEGIAKANIKIPDTAVETQYQALVTQAGGKDKLAEQLKTANMTEDQLRVNIAKQLAIQQYLSQNINVSSATVTDAEVKKYYDDNTKGQTNVPAFKDVSAQIKQTLINQKQQLLINTFLASLRASAQIATSTSI